MFIAALCLVTIREKQKQPKCTSVDKWLETLWHVHTMILSNKTEQTIETCYTWTHLQRMTLSEKKRADPKSFYILYNSIYIAFLK